MDRDEKRVNVAMKKIAYGFVCSPIHFSSILSLILFKLGQRQRSKLQATATTTTKQRKRESNKRKFFLIIFYPFYSI